LALLNPAQAFVSEQCYYKRLSFYIMASEQQTSKYLPCVKYKPHRVSSSAFESSRKLCTTVYSRAPQFSASKSGRHISEWNGWKIIRQPADFGRSSLSVYLFKRFRKDSLSVHLLARAMFCIYTLSWTHSSRYKNNEFACRSVRLRWICQHKEVRRRKWHTAWWLIELAYKRYRFLRFH